MRRLWLFIDVDNMTDVLKICGVVKRFYCSVRKFILKKNISLLPL